MTRLLALLRIVLLVLGIVLVPYAIAIAQTSDTSSTNTDQTKDKDKKEGEEVQGQEKKLEEEVTVTGTRVEGRVATETSAPVDIVDRETIMATGATETGKALQLLAPSFNFTNTTISDGTD